MKRTVTCALILILTAGAPLRAQEYPFQDTKLPEEERLDNAVSLMTVDEKIATLVGQGVPRLGIAGPGSTEAIHGIVRGGATDLPALRSGSNGNRPVPKYRNSTAFPQAYGIGETWDREKVKRIAVFGNRAEQVLKDWYGALPTYRVSPLEGIKAAVDTTQTEVRFLRWDHDGSAQELARWADVCIVCVGNHPNTSPDWDGQTVQSPWGYGVVAGDSREAVDRRSLQLETEDLVKVVWQANPNTVVTLISSFPYAINWTAENVPAIVHLTQCSQELGNALADVLFGEYNPAGRLTQTWVRNILDLPNMLDYDIRHGRTYMYSKAKPLFPFGHGLSYTTFKYSHLKIKKEETNYVVRFDLKNTGSRDGEEVVQLYARFKGDDASKRLRAFERVTVKAGETVPVELIVPEDDLKLWDSGKHAFTLRKGRTRILVGASSEDIRLHKRIRL